jgi:NIPSNAP
MQRLVEIRTYRLKPGTRDTFHEAMHSRAVPMLRARGMDVVAYGTSDHEEPSYFLARAYADHAALLREQAAFYSSSEWITGPRQELVTRIDTYLNTLVWLSDGAVQSLRELNLVPG